MRNVLAALPLLALAACGGASGPESIGSVAPPAGTGSSGTGGTGGGVGTGTGTVTPTPTPTSGQFLDVSTETSFNAVGALQSLTVFELGTGKEGPKSYAGNASTVRAPSGTITYSPRDGIFTVNFTDSKASVTTGNLRFQDPGHRSAEAYSGVPTNLPDFNIVRARGGTARAPTAGDATDLGRVDEITFFYQRPGSQTNYVSLAGYVRSAYEPTKDPMIQKKDTQSLFERGAFVFGQETLRSQIPVTGTGTYTGGMLATMIANNTPTVTPNYFQWITGSSEIAFDFSRSTVSILLTGTVQPATYAGQLLPENATGVPGGAIFTARGSGTINLTQTGGFTGNFTSAGFSKTNGDPLPNFQSVNPNNSVAGANSIDGTFFGPNAVNVGGNFRIVGGVPDQRVDIMGAFTGAKK